MDEVTPRYIRFPREDRVVKEPRVPGGMGMLTLKFPIMYKMCVLDKWVNGHLCCDAFLYIIS